MDNIFVLSSSEEYFESQSIADMFDKIILRIRQGEENLFRFDLDDTALDLLPDTSAESAVLYIFAPNKEKALEEALTWLKQYTDEAEESDVEEFKKYVKKELREVN